MAAHPSPFEVPVESIADSVDTPRGSAYLNAPPGFARDSSAISTPAESSPFLAQGNKEANFIDSRDALPARRPLYKRTWFWVAAVVAVVVVALAVVLPVIFVVVKPGQHHSTSGASSSSSSGSSGSNGSGDSGSNGSGTTTTKTGITIGGDGSTVTKDDGTTFVYKNPFGGYCECLSTFSPCFPRNTPLVHASVRTSTVGV